VMEPTSIPTVIILLPIRIQILEFSLLQNLAVEGIRCMV